MWRQGLKALIFLTLLQIAIVIWFHLTEKIVDVENMTKKKSKQASILPHTQEKTQLRISLTKNNISMRSVDKSEMKMQSAFTTTHWCHSRDLLSDSGKRASCVFKNVCAVATTNSSHEVEWLYVSDEKPKDVSFTLGIGPHSVDEKLYFEPIHLTRKEFESSYPVRTHESGTSVVFYEYNAENFGHMLTDVLMPIHFVLESFDMYSNQVKLFRYSINDSIGWSCDYQIQIGTERAAKNCKRMYEILPPLLTKHPVKVLKTFARVPLCFDTVVVGMSQYSDDCMEGSHGRETNKWSLCNHGRQKQFWNFRATLLKNAGIKNISPSRHQIVITNRTDPPRVLHNLDVLVSRLRQNYGNESVLVVEWHKLTLKKQLEIISSATVLVTPPGGVSFISMFLPRWATTIRLYSTDFMLEWHLFNYLGYLYPEHVNCRNGEIPVNEVAKLVEAGLTRFDSLKNTRSVQSMIPSTIYHTWITKENMPFQMKENMDKWNTLNPEYKTVFFNDTQQSDWMKQECNEYFKVWQSMLLPVARADLFRYCLLWKEGGVWSDVDVVPLLPLRRVIDSGTDLVVVHDDGMGKEFLYNAFFAVKPRHPVLKRAMDIIHKHYQQRLQKGAVWVTGPKVLWTAFNDTQYQLSLAGKQQTIQFLSFDGHSIKNVHNEIVMKGKYNGYLEDAKTNGGEPHYGREVTWSKD